MKQIIRSGINEKKLELFNFNTDIYVNPPHNFKWMKLNKEFLLGNKMYDIVRTEISYTGLKFYCINDVQEELLVNNFQKLNYDINSSSIPQKKATLKTIQFNLLLYICKFWGYPFFNSETEKLYFFYKSNYSFSFLKKIFNPPNVNIISKYFQIG